MKCAVAIVLAFIGLVVTNPVPPVGLGIGSPVYFRTSVVNHGVTVPVARPVVAAPVVAGIAPAWGGYGLGGWGGHGLGGWGGHGLGGWGGYGLGGWGGHGLGGWGGYGLGGWGGLGYKG